MQVLSSDTDFMGLADDQKQRIEVWLKYLDQNEVTCTKEIEEKRKKLEEYEKLKEQITDLNKKLEKNVFIPVGRMAFLPGTLDRTNEFHTVIGDNHFVKKSAFRTVELLKRRKKVIQDQIQKLEEELKMVNQRKEFADQLSKVAATGEVEIREPYEEPKQPPKTIDQPTKVTDADYEALMKRLDDLEALEEEEDALLSELDSDDLDDSEMAEEEMKYEKILNDELAKRKEANKVHNLKKGVRFSDDTLGPSNSSPLIQEISDFKAPQPILKHTDHVPRIDQQAIEAMNRREQTLILPESKVALKGTIVERDPMAMLDQPQSSSTNQKQSKFKSQRKNN